MEDAENSLGDKGRLRRPPEKKRPLGNEALNSTESQSSRGTSTSMVVELRSLLGNDVVLLPIPRGRKNPIFKGWQSTTLGRMQDPKYLAQFNHQGNIGVLLGNGLITIDIDQDQAVEPFLARNPKLRATLRTRRVRGSNFW